MRRLIFSMCVFASFAAMAMGQEPTFFNRPTATISVDQESVAKGTTVRISYAGTNGTATLNDESVELSGYKDVVITETKDFTFRVTGKRRVATDGVTVEATDPVEPTPTPAPVKGLSVIIVGPTPRAVRDLTPDQAAILTSRKLRDYLEATCGTDSTGATAYRAIARSVDTASLDQHYRNLLGKAPSDGFSLVAVSGKKEYVGALPADVDAVLKILVDVSGVTAGSRPVGHQPTPKCPTAEQWAKYTSHDGRVVVDGQIRLLSAKHRDLKAKPYGSAGVSLKAAGINLIPRSEWPARIEALKKANAGLMALSYGKVPCSDQDGLGFCWVHSAKNAAQFASYVQGQRIYELSAVSVGGPITGYRNEGGWPSVAVEYMQKHGAVGTALWPENDLDSSYAKKAAVKGDYKKHRIAATIADLGETGNIFDECVTCVLLGSPVAVSYNWWGHAIVMVGVTEQDGVYYGVFRNSWGDDWSGGDKGFFLMPEGTRSNEGTPDDAQAVLMMSQLDSVVSAAIEAAQEPPAETAATVRKESPCANGQCGLRQRRYLGKLLGR